jgi:hypothetical protein
VGAGQRSSKTPASPTSPSDPASTPSAALPAKNEHAPSTCAATRSSPSGKAEPGAAGNGGSRSRGRLARFAHGDAPQPPGQVAFGEPCEVEELLGLSSQRDPGERLEGACGRDVLFPVLTGHEPVGADLASQLGGAVAGHGQAGAVLGPVWREAAEDGDGARDGGRVQGVQVLLPMLIGGQEMKGRPVMPGLVVTLWMPAENVGGQPANLASPRAEVVPGVLHRGCGDVEDGEVAEAAVQQCPGEGEAPPPTSMRHRWSRHRQRRASEATCPGVPRTSSGCHRRGRRRRPSAPTPVPGRLSSYPARLHLPVGYRVAVMTGKNPDAGISLHWAALEAFPRSWPYDQAHNRAGCASHQG